MRRTNTAAAVAPAAETNKSDARVEILMSLLTTPHRDFDEYHAFHTACITRDIDYYAKLATDYNKTGVVRDHKVAFTANLLSCHDQEYRDVGFMLLQTLPAHQVIRVISYIKKYFGKLKRSTETAVYTYLKVLEADESSFDKVAIGSGKHLRNLYRGLHLPPGDRAQKVLFDGEAPKDSLAEALQTITESEDPTEQAKLIVKHRIPYTTAVGVIKQFTPAVMVALINNMTKQQLLNNMISLERHDAFNNPDVVDLVKRKLAQKGGGKIAAMKTTLAKSETMNQEIVKAIDDAASASLKSSGTISKTTALLLDSSSSMDEALEIGKRVAAAISDVCISDFYLYTFDVFCKEYKTKNRKLADYEKDFRNLTLGDSTSIGAPLRQMIKLKQKVEQICLITDEKENSDPRFVETLKEYVRVVGVKPTIVMVRIGNYSRITQDLKDAGFEVDVYLWNHKKGDYYAIPQIISLLSKGSILDAVIDIMGTELPVKPRNLRELYISNKERNILTDLVENGLELTQSGEGYVTTAEEPKKVNAVSVNKLLNSRMLYRKGNNLVVSKAGHYCVDRDME